MKHPYKSGGATATLSITHAFNQAIVVKISK